MARAEFGGHQRRGTVRRVGLALWNIERDEDFRHHVQCKELRSASTPQPTQPRKKKRTKENQPLKVLPFGKATLHLTSARTRFGPKNRKLGRKRLIKIIFF